MTRTFYFFGGLVALTLAFALLSLVRVQPPTSGAAARPEVALAAAAPDVLDAGAVAIADLASWPATTGR